MTVFSDQLMKTDLMVFLRNSDILSIAVRGVTTVSETFSGTGSSQTITLTNNIVRNIRSVNDGAAKYAYFDYTPTYAATTTIVGTFTAGSSNITVTYDYSTSMNERIWPDYPELANPEITVNSFPRVGFEFLAKNTQVIGIGNPNYLVDAMVSVKFYDNSTKSLDNYITLFRQAVKTNQKSLYSFPFMHTGTTGPVITHADLAYKVKEKTVDWYLKFRFES